MAIDLQRLWIALRQDAQFGIVFQWTGEVHHLRPVLCGFDGRGRSFGG